MTETYTLRTSVTVPLPPEQAFTAFTEGIDRWWIREYTWSGAGALHRIAIEPREDGLCYEIGPYGLRLDWGRVLTWEAPRRLVFTWHISPQRVPQPDPADASEVEVRFESEGAGTRVELEHRRIDRHGPGAPAYRGQLALGWDDLLARYAAAAGR